MESNNIKRWSLSMHSEVENPDVLRDPLFLSKLVRTIASTAGMRIINLTVTDVVEEIEKLNMSKFHDEGGISVLALISTSHIALHTWPNRLEFMFDFVSCRFFEREQINKIIRDELKVKRCKYYESN